MELYFSHLPHLLAQWLWPISESITLQVSSFRVGWICSAGPISGSITYRVLPIRVGWICSAGPITFRVLSIRVGRISCARTTPAEVPTQLTSYPNAFPSAHLVFSTSKAPPPSPSPCEVKGNLQFRVSSAEIIGFRA